MQWITDMIAGVVFGALAGIGTGGGSLLLLWLTAVRDMPPDEARTVNLLFFLPGALMATILRKKQDRVSYKDLLPAIAAGCTAAGIASLLGRNIDHDLLKKLFGGLLIAAGIREVLYRDRT